MTKPHRRRESRPSPLLVAQVVVRQRLGAGRDIVDVFFRLLVAPVLVVLVESADRTFLDRTLRPAVAVFARRLALVVRGRVRAEVGAARPGGRSGRAP